MPREEMNHSVREAIVSLRIALEHFEAAVTHDSELARGPTEIGDIWLLQRQAERVVNVLLRWRGGTPLWCERCQHAVGVNLHPNPERAP